jgi:hypothetical protein
MAEAANILPPRTLIDTFEKSFAPGSPSHTDALWSAFHKETGQVMALSVKTLAMLWDSAWKAGSGSKNHGHRRPEDLRAAYENPNFLRSVTVDEIEDEIAHPTPLDGSKKAKTPSLAASSRRKASPGGARNGRLKVAAAGRTRGTRKAKKRRGT